MAKVADRIKDIVKKEQRGLSWGIGYDPNRVAVSRAAHAAGRLATGSTAGSIAEYLGTGIGRMQQRVLSISGKEVHGTTSAEDRRRYGYGDLPDDLIREVSREITSLVPDSGTPPGLIRMCAARTMQIVSNRPDISAAAIRDSFMRVEPDHPLAMSMPPALRPAELACLDSIVTTAHFMTSQYFGINETQGEQ